MSKEGHGGCSDFSVLRCLIENVSSFYYLEELNKKLKIQIKGERILHQNLLLTSWIPKSDLRKCILVISLCS